MKSAANKLPNDPQVLQQMLLAAMAREADMYTLMGTAKLNGVDPRAYLTAVLKRINNTPITEIE